MQLWRVLVKSRMKNLVGYLAPLVEHFQLVLPWGIGDDGIVSGQPTVSSRIKRVYGVLCSINMFLQGSRQSMIAYYVSNDLHVFIMLGRWKLWNDVCFNGNSSISLWDACF